MPVSEPKPVLLGAVTLATFVACVIASRLYGIEAAIRCFGAFLAGTGLWLSARPEMPIYLGSRRVASVRGWQKFALTVPQVALGSGLLFAPATMKCLATAGRSVC